jgi:hypothetical protein
MTRSGEPWTASGMKDLNAPHEAPVQAFLDEIVRTPQAHARLMNMLSMLEHIGSRKIMLSQMDKVLTEDTLKHMAEEARHAYFFKRQAERIAGKALDGYTNENTLCRAPAALYFGRLDAAVSAEAGADKAYFWVSLIVELRACWFYGIYSGVLERAGLKISLKSLLAEEDMHLAEMYAMCGRQDSLLRTLCACETGLFIRLLRHMQTAIALPQAA